jgi:hypothetical protein
VETLLAPLDVFETRSEAVLEVSLEEGDARDLLLDHGDEQICGGEELRCFVL